MRPTNGWKSICAAAALSVFAVGTAEASNSGSWRAPAPDDRLYAVTIFMGEGTEDNFSNIIENFFNVERSTDHVLGLTGSRLLGWYGPSLSFEAELMYAYHYGREVYHEIGTAAYARWHDFPWNDYLSTTAAIGMGPSYTTEFPQLEAQPDGSRSRLLNQLNLQTTFAMPSRPDIALVARMQHRSGMFGAFNGVTDASNFLTLGLRYEF
ncbi:MAG: hypothetical protein CVT72_08020 [Alphaproteobacteria bacterium HGW-Alphaproteobacteria-11]|nr:MAG: hypothetical protein CVT72_08020 [Alphaproteobacteria bacterium HGW-Alphaproteobacteria-11]